MGQVPTLLIEKSDGRKIQDQLSRPYLYSLDCSGCILDNRQLRGLSFEPRLSFSTNFTLRLLFTHK